jgi:adenylate cyclase
VTEQRVQRRLAAILAADVVGYSALMERDEEATYAEFERLKRELIEPNLSRHEGRLIKTTGDGALAEFASPLAAVRCAVEIQDGLASGSRGFRLRIGINLGDVIVGTDGDLFGDGINIAVRLEGVADPGGILISEKVYSEIEGKLDVAFEGRGEQQLKNISKPVRAYAVRAGAHSVLTERLGTAPPLPDKPSIAVLPFENMSGDPEQEYFSDGVVEEIITALSRTRWLFVIARNSSFTYRGRSIDVKQVGRELGVRYVLEGSVRKAGDRLRIAAQLIDASTGTHLWADRFEGRLDDIFDLQDQVTARVVGAIRPKLEKAEMQRSQRKPTESLDAYDYYLRGLASFYRAASRETNAEALRLFSRAIELDPDFALAYGYAATCYGWRMIQGWLVDPAKELSEAERLARRGAVLGKDDAVALSHFAWTLAHVARDLDAGASTIDRALALDPNNALSLARGGLIKIWLGQADVGIELVARAMRLSPLDPLMPWWQHAIALGHFVLGRYEEASSWAAMGLQEAPDNHALLRISAASNALAGRLVQARKAVGRLRELNPLLRVSNFREFMAPFRRADDLARVEDGLRKAGLPE